MVQDDFDRICTDFLNRDTCWVTWDATAVLTHIMQNVPHEAAHNPIRVFTTLCEYLRSADSAFRSLPNVPGDKALAERHYPSLSLLTADEHHIPYKSVRAR